MVVVADTTPLNYLISIDQVSLLPALFGKVLIPRAVLEELQDEDTPERVRSWIADAPSWLQLASLQLQPDPTLDYLDAGEREAMALAEQFRADQLLLDEAAARREAARRDLPFIGTLGVLREAARRGLIDLPKALAQLQATTFYVSPVLIRSLLDEDAADKRRETEEGD
jgi:predicted nucleic acid-binding protein